MQWMMVVLFAATIPWLTPYPGSEQVGEAKVSDFDEHAMLVGPHADRSGLEVFRNDQVAAQKDNVYIALHFDRHNAMIVSVETKGMQGGLVKVTAEEPAGDLMELVAQ